MYVFLSVGLPMLWELAKVSICVILHSLMPSGFLTKSIYMPTLKFDGLTRKINLPLIEQDSKS